MRGLRVRPHEAGRGLPGTNYPCRMIRVVFFIALFAAVLYAAFWLIDRRSKGGGSSGSKPAGPPSPRGPVGPDDDEEFLRELERKRRHRKREEET